MWAMRRRDPALAERILTVARTTYDVLGGHEASLWTFGILPLWRQFSGAS